MSDVIKGNFKTKKEVKVEIPEEDLTTLFEKEALKRLGGSISFVSKEKFIYGADKKSNANKK